MRETSSAAVSFEIIENFSFLDVSELTESLRLGRRQKKSA
jgi:hypothetical protein